MTPNTIAVRPLKTLKRALVRPGRATRVVPFGLYRGARLELDLGYQTQLYAGLLERETYSAIRTAAARSEWFVDGGAAEGELVAYFLRQPHVRQIIAFEPEDEHQALLARNIALNRQPSSPAVTIRREWIGAVTIPGRTIRLDDAGLPETPGFIKLDIEGAELEALQGADRLLRRAHPDVLVETHSAELEAACAAFLEARGYRVRIIPNAWWRVLLPEDRPAAHNRWLSASVR